MAGYPRNPIASDRGMSTIVFLVLMAVGVVVFGAIQGLSRAMSNQAMGADVRANLQLVRRNIVVAVSNAASWQRTIQINAANYPTQSRMGCLASTTTQCSDGVSAFRDSPFVLYDSTPTSGSGGGGGFWWDGSGGTLGRTVPGPVTAGSPAIVNSVDPGAGFNDKGEPCTGFHPTNATNNCYFRFEIKWSAVCNVPNCLSPFIEVNGNFQIAQNIPLRLNLGDLSIPPIYLRSQ